MVAYVCRDFIPCGENEDGCIKLKETRTYGAQSRELSLEIVVLLDLIKEKKTWSLRATVEDESPLSEVTSLSSHIIKEIVLNVVKRVGFL